MIRDRAEGPVESSSSAAPRRPRRDGRCSTRSARAAAIVIGPSNPLASIAPILAVPGIRQAMRSSRAPVVAVSPIVAGQVLKGPTAAFMAYAGHELSAAGVAAFYGELLDGIVADEPVPGLATLDTDTRMDDAGARERLAEQTYRFAVGLGGR